MNRKGCLILIGAIVVVIIFFLVIRLTKADEVSGYWGTVMVVCDDQVNEDATFGVAVRVEGVTNLAGYELEIRYDPSVIRARSVTEGMFLSDRGSTFWVEPDISNSTGVISEIICVRTGYGGVSGDGLLFTVTFDARSVGVSQIGITMELLLDAERRMIHVTTLDGTVRVVEYPEWDVNQDGRTDVYDLVLVGQSYGEFITGNPTPNPDVNRDGRVDLYDLSRVAHHFGETYSLAPSQIRKSRESRELVVELRKLRQRLASGNAEEREFTKILHKLMNPPRVKLTTWANMRR